MNHYPTSAELAAFRDAGSPYVLHPVAGAYSDERTIGIGYRAAEGYMPEYVKPDPGQPWDGYHVSMSANDADRVYAIRARREASRMRSRAYYRLSHDPTTEPALPVLDLLHPDGAYFGPWYEETSYGAPYTWNVCECCGNPHTYCDCYGIAV